MPALPRFTRHTAAMGVTWAVLTDTEQEARDELERGCELLGLVPLGRPNQVVGRDRWIARAQVPVPQPQGAGE